MSGNPTEDKRLGDEPAHSSPHFVRPDGDIEWGETGLTKREMLAAMAMQGMLANPNHAEFIHSHTERSALAALAADALLKELARG